MVTFARSGKGIAADYKRNNPTDTASVLETLAVTWFSFLPLYSPNSLRHSSLLWDSDSLFRQGFERGTF